MTASIPAPIAVPLPALLALTSLIADASAEPIRPKNAELQTITPTSSYIGWPTLVRRRTGELWVVASGGREAHVCPFGQVIAITSSDEGRSWTWPRVLHDGPIDDRDAGVLETARGTLIATTFTSLAYVDLLKKAQASGAWTADKIARWNGVHQRLSDSSRNAQLGQWTLRSEDGGISWSAAERCPTNSPHGPIQLRDGRLLYPGKALWTEDKAVGVWESRDDGKSWQHLAKIPTRAGDDPTKGYHELHGVEASNGTLIVHIRNHNNPNANETLQTESSDGGRSWTNPHPLKVTDGSSGVWGLPSHLLRLQDGRLLMTYGHRRAPLGNQARISADHGASWSQPILVSDDATSGDLGYPSTAELADQTLLTVWYEKIKDSPNAVLRQCRWSLP